MKTEAKPTHTPGPFEVVYVEDAMGYHWRVRTIDGFSGKPWAGAMSGTGTVAMFKRAEDATVYAAAHDLLEASTALDLHMMKGGKMHQGHPLHMALRAAIAKALPAGSKP